MSEDVTVGTTTPNKRTRLPVAKRKQLERDLDHITVEMYKRNRELSETNKTLSLLQIIDSVVLEPHTTLTMVCQHIAEAITQVTDYPFVGLLTRSGHGQESLALSGWSVGGSISKYSIPTLGFSKPPRFKLSHPWFDGLEGTALVPLDNLSNEALADFLQCSVREVQRVQKQLPLQSLYVVKLLARRQIVGLLVVGYEVPTSLLQPTDTALVNRLSESIGVALDNKLLFEENRHVLRQLKESNSKLMALDEAKDDFISMASHQLRTPLTSIKGYTSMVLEGDAGEISPTQKKLLTQSYFSAQRMVYMIADLLNVSRLRTGKFIIETTPLNLADVVEEELEQLRETAVSRALHLIYKKPRDFPLLMLDETKIRQVIMNFTDNAIYYTPAGGHITIELKATPTVVEFRVEDDGIGVPRNEQPHLFTKFYRAANARKARPDGTGLGIYMAKKVIIAQGGALIFNSREGEGSSFGFVFSRVKHGVPAASEPAKS